MHAMVVAICILLYALTVNPVDVAVSTLPSVRGFDCPYHRALLDGQYHVYWCIKSNHVAILMQANTTGWIGIGFAPNNVIGGKMKDADIAIGYVDGNGMVVLDDCYGMSSVGKPAKDTDHGGTYDLFNVVGWEEDGWTSIQFDHLLTPTDTAFDRAIDLTSSFSIIAAFGASDDMSMGHTSRTVTSAVIMPYSSLTTYGAAPNNVYRSINGSGNNVDHPTWGQTGDHYIWKEKNYYGDGISTPAGSLRPSARDISNRLFARDDAVQSVDVSILLIHMGQLLAHDISYTTGSNEYWPIPIPACDPIFDINCETSGSNMSFHRSAYGASTGTSTSNPRMQTNGQTAFIDASHVYGQTEERTRALRTMVDGKMKLDSGHILPDGFAASVFMEHESQCPCRMRSAGDPRANVHSALFAMHTVFVREHNRWCDVLQPLHPDWNDEVLFQEARRRVIAIWQKIALYEYLPAVLGRPPVLWTSYDPKVAPRITHEFNVCAFRYGHSELPNLLYRFDKHGIASHVLLTENLFNSYDGLLDYAVEATLRGAVRQRPGKSDLRFASGVRSFLFGHPLGTQINGTDLSARSIQRGRDHGIGDYKAIRAAYGLSVPSHWSDVSSDAEDVALLEQIFRNADDADLYVGGLAEDKNGSSLVGSLYTAILEENFRALRDGDRFWFENNQFSSEELSEILSTDFGQIIRRNTNLTDMDLPSNVFYLDTRYTSISLLSDFPTSDGFPDPQTLSFPHPIRYEHEQIVMAHSYKVLWSADATYVHFMLQVKTIGWVGIGFTPNQRGVMIGADIVLARFINGVLEIEDRSAILNVGKPLRDVDQGGHDNVENAYGIMTKGWSIVRFSRKRKTEDTVAGLDREIYEDRDVYTIFAFQQDTAELQYHGHNVHGEPIRYQSAQIELQSLNSVPFTLRIASYVMGGSGIVLTLALALFQSYYRTNPCISLSSPAINNIMFIGAILAYVALPHFAMDSTEFCDADATIAINMTTFVGDPDRIPIAPCSAGASLCLRRVWLLSLAFTLIFSSMFSKTYRVHRICVQAAITLKKIQIKNKDLYMIIGILTAIDCIVLLSFTLASPFTLIRAYSGFSTTTPQYLTRYVIDHCVTESDAFWIVMFTYKAVVMILAAYTATTTRNVVIANLRDFSSVGVTIYSILMVCCIVLPALYLLGNESTVCVTLSIVSIFICTTTTLLIQFVPKIHKVYWGIEDREVGTMSRRETNKLRMKQSKVVAGVSRFTTSAYSVHTTSERLNSQN